MEQESAGNNDAVQFTVADDGAISAEEVRPGTYTLIASVQRIVGADSGPARVEVLAIAHREFTVPPLDGQASDEPLELGSIPLQPAPKPEVGKPLPSADSLDLVDPDGKPLKLQDLRGKVVLLHVFPMHGYDLIAPIRQAHEQHKDNERFAIVNVGVNMLPAWERRIAKSQQIPGLLALDANISNTNAQLRLAARLSLSKLPTALLIGADGNLIATDLKPEELVAAVSQALNSR
jgi:hypothetical protein